MLATRSYAGIFIALSAAMTKLLGRAVDLDLLDSGLCIGRSLHDRSGRRRLSRRTSNTPATNRRLRRFSRRRFRDCTHPIAVGRSSRSSQPMAAMRRCAGHRACSQTIRSDHRVAEAFRQLFAALLAARRGNRIVCERHSGEAQLRFEDFECDYYATRCLELAGRLGRGAAPLPSHGGARRRATHRTTARSARPTVTKLRGQPRTS